MNKSFLVSSFLLVSPLITFAADIKSMIQAVGGVIDAAFPVALSFAVVYFAWQVIQYTIAGGGKDALSGIVWGLIGITVIVGIWGFVGAIKSTLGI